MPTAASRARSAGVWMPLSPTITLAGGHARRQPLADRERGLEHLEIAVVDADQPRLQLQRAVELGLVVHLDQHVHAERERRVFELARGRVVERTP